MMFTLLYSTFDSLIYITSHKNARSLIMKVERDELVEEMLKEYIKTNHWK